MNRIMQSSLALFWVFASQTSWALPAEATDDVINGDEDTAITGNLLANDLVPVFLEGWLHGLVVIFGSRNVSRLYVPNGVNQMGFLHLISYM